MAQEERFLLLKDAAATGSWFNWPGGMGTFFAWGTYAGATVQLECAPDEGNTPIRVGDNVTFVNPTENKAIGNFHLAPCRIRAAIIGAGATITAVARPALAS